MCTGLRPGPWFFRTVLARPGRRAAGRLAAGVGRDAASLLPVVSFFASGRLGATGRLEPQCTSHFSVSAAFPLARAGHVAAAGGGGWKNSCHPLRGGAAVTWGRGMRAGEGEGVGYQTWRCAGRCAGRVALAPALAEGAGHSSLSSPDPSQSGAEGPGATEVVRGARLAVS